MTASKSVDTLEQKKLLTTQVTRETLAAKT